MQLNTEIQNKVLKIASNTAIDNKVRLAVRKQFYMLKSEELDIEALQEELNSKIVQFNSTLDKILEEINSITTIESPERQKKDEEILIPKKSSNSSGVKVRMQEELEDLEENEEIEVPFEAIEES